MAGVESLQPNHDIELKLAGNDLALNLFRRIASKVSTLEALTDGPLVEYNPGHINPITIEHHHVISPEGKNGFVTTLEAVVPITLNIPEDQDPLMPFPDMFYRLGIRNDDPLLGINFDPRLTEVMRQVSEMIFRGLTDYKIDNTLALAKAYAREVVETSLLNELRIDKTGTLSFRNTTYKIRDEFILLPPEDDENFGEYLGRIGNGKDAIERNIYGGTLVANEESPIKRLQLEYQHSKKVFASYYQLHHAQAQLFYKYILEDIGLDFDALNLKSKNPSHILFLIERLNDWQKAAEAKAEIFRDGGTYKESNALEDAAKVWKTRGQDYEFINQLADELYFDREVKQANKLRAKTTVYSQSLSHMTSSLDFDKDFEREIKWMFDLSIYQHQLHDVLMGDIYNLKEGIVDYPKALIIEKPFRANLTMQYETRPQEGTFIPKPYLIIRLAFGSEESAGSSKDPAKSNLSRGFAFGEEPDHISEEIN